MKQPDSGEIKKHWPVLLAVTLCAAGLMSAQSSASGSASTPPATMSQLMVDLIHPASNDILLFVYRGGSKDEKEWAAIRRSALTLAESGNLLLARVPGSEWAQKAKLLQDSGNAAYIAAQAKDLKALSAITPTIDASCTACHKQFRPNVFPREGGSQ
jgi:hypothetical protein